jgi:hypothetical protein
MSFATSTPRSGSTGGWVSLYRRRHFPRSPRVQENPRAPSELGTHVTFRHSFVELVTVADDRHGGPVGAEATLVPLQAPPEILDRLTENIEQTADRLSAALARFERWRGSRPLESLPAA